MGTHADPHSAAADQIIDSLWDVISADQGKLGEALAGLFRQTDEHRWNSQWDRATECCRTGQLVAHQVRDSMGTFAFRFAEGFIQMQLGAIHLSQDELGSARQCFQKAVEQFRGCNRHRCQAVAWMALGDAYVLAKEWEMAIHGFQQSLNALSRLWSSDAVTAELEGRVRTKLEGAQFGFSSSARKAQASKAVDGSPSRLQRPGIPILGTIGAGAGRIAERHVEGHLDLGADHANDAKFALRVQGRSMIECGILEGDLALIREQADVERGAIGAILVSGSLTEGTLKRYYRERDHHRLEPCNANEPTVIVIPDQGDGVPPDEDANEGPRSAEQISDFYERQGKKTSICSGEVRVVGKLVAIFRQVH